MKTPAAAVDVTRYAREYERLRSQFGPALLQGAFGPPTPPLRGIGLALLLRDGMPAWIRAVRQVLSEAATSPAGIGSQASTPLAPAASPLLAASADGGEQRFPSVRSLRPGGSGTSRPCWRAWSCRPGVRPRRGQ